MSDLTMVRRTVRMDAEARRGYRASLAGARTCSASVLFAALDTIDRLEAQLAERPGRQTATGGPDAATPRRLAVAGHR